MTKLRQTMLNAARLLSREARAIKDCHTIDGKWGDDPNDAQAKRDHAFMLLTAAALRAMAKQEKERELELRRPIAGRDDDVIWTIHRSRSRRKPRRHRTTTSGPGKAPGPRL